MVSIIIVRKSKYTVPQRTLTTRKTHFKIKNGDIQRIVRLRIVPRNSKNEHANSLVAVQKRGYEIRIDSISHIEAWAKKRQKTYLLESNLFFKADGVFYAKNHFQIKTVVEAEKFAEDWCNILFACIFTDIETEQILERGDLDKKKEICLKELLKEKITVVRSFS